MKKFTEKEKMAYATIATLEKERDTLHAQLAERDALLAKHADHIATLCDVMFRHGLGMDKEAEQKIYAALAQQQLVFAALSTTAKPEADHE